MGRSEHKWRVRLNVISYLLEHVPRPRTIRSISCRSVSDRGAAVRAWGPIEFTHLASATSGSVSVRLLEAKK